MFKHYQNVKLVSKVKGVEILNGDMNWKSEVVERVKVPSGSDTELKVEFDDSIFNNGLVMAIYYQGKDSNLYANQSQKHTACNSISGLRPSQRKIASKDIELFIGELTQLEKAQNEELYKRFPERLISKLPDQIRDQKRYLAI